MIKIKSSLFNVYYKASDGTQLAFNSVTCGLATVDESYAKLMEALPSLTGDNVPDELKDTYAAAVEGHFIVEDDFDELLDLSTKRMTQKYNVSSLGLTIAPTLACNFKCVYCYETSKQGLMSQDVMDHLVAYVQNHAPHLTDLSIAWYGGEPLMGLPVLRYLSQKFMEICKANDIRYGAFMISNGSLLTQDIVEELVSYKVSGIQITIDGPKDIHDKRRVAKNGDSTFDKIIDNINMLLSHGEIEVVLRINIDKTNENDLDALLQVLSERFISKKVRITFGQVTAYTEACRSIESTCFNNMEFAANVCRYYGAIKKYGFDVYNDFPYPAAKLNYCCAELLNSFVVDHEGYLYKCWNQIGDIERAVGNILAPDFDVAGYKNGQWLTRDPIADPECRACALLPICMGGCPYNSMIQGKSHECDLVKYNIQDIMLAYYDQCREGDI